MTNEALLNEARAIDADAAAASAPPVDPNAPPATPPPAAVDPIAEARELVDFAFSCVDPVYPSLKKIYTPEVMQKIATKLGPLMQKYELAGGAWMVKWREEIGFAMVALPLVVPTVEAIRADAAARKKKEAPGNTAAASGAGSPPPATEAPAIGGDKNKPIVEEFPPNL